MKENSNINQQIVWNAIAPEWSEFKTEPARHVKEFLKGKKGNILDLGSGSGRHLKKIPKGKMYLVDFSEKMIELAKEKAKKKKIPAEFFVADLTKLPFEKDFFDSAIFIAVLHCIEGEKNREKAVKELFRVLKKGSQVEVAVWNKNCRKFRNAKKERLVNWRDKGARYYYLFDAEEIYKLFEKVGFKIVFKEEPSDFAEIRTGTCKRSWEQSDFANASEFNCNERGREQKRNIIFVAEKI